jgi:hypothetical protein
MRPDQTIQQATRTWRFSEAISFYIMSRQFKRAVSVALQGRGFAGCKAATARSSASRVGNRNYEEQTTYVELLQIS